MTGYFKVNSFTQSTQNGPAHIELVARGGRNTRNIGTIGGLSRQCEATTYHSNTYVDGRVKFEKDLEHTKGYTTNDPEKLHVVSPLVGQWIWIKAVFYNLRDGHSVKLNNGSATIMITGIGYLVMLITVNGEAETLIVAARIIKLLLGEGQLQSSDGTILTIWT